MATTKNKTTTKRKAPGKTKTGERRIRRVGACRPQIMTESTIQKLEEGFAKWLNVMECCLFANISKSTYYNFTTEHTEYLERFEIRKKLEQKLSEFEALKTKLNNLINQIDDVQSRRLLKLRYFQYLEWEEIREHLNYGSLEYVRGELHGKSLQKLLKLHT